MTSPTFLGGSLTLVDGKAWVVEPDYRTLAMRLSGCSMLPGSWDKRFSRDMAYAAQNDGCAPYTEKQREHILRLAYKYRRQMPDWKWPPS